MSFDEIPENKTESYPCECGEGTIAKLENGRWWQCDTCSWSRKVKNKKEDKDAVS